MVWDITVIQPQFMVVEKQQVQCWTKSRLGMGWKGMGRGLWCCLTPPLCAGDSGYPTKDPYAGGTGVPDTL